MIGDQQLGELQLFQGVNPETVRQWLDQCQKVSFDEGDVILRPDCENERMYVLLDGAVSIRLDDLNNAPIAHVYQGECIGEMSVFDGKNPSAFVQAEVNTTMMEIKRQVLLDLIDNSHGVARNLLYLLSNRLRMGNEAVTNSRHLQQEYEKHANVDILTGLHNRRWLQNYFERISNRASSDGVTPDFSLLMIDVDYFKHFNDAQGHLAGDEALRSVADALRESTRPTDHVARYGGEEFVVILPSTNLDDALIVAERIRANVETREIYFQESLCPCVTVSIGVAKIRESENIEALLMAADRAMYAAKSGGRNLCKIAED